MAFKVSYCSKSRVEGHHLNLILPPKTFSNCLVALLPWVHVVTSIAVLTCVPFSTSSQSKIFLQNSAFSCVVVDIDSVKISSGFIPTELRKSVVNFAECFW